MASTKKEGLLTKLIKFVFTIACIVLLIVVIVGIQTVTTVGNWVSNVSVGSFDIFGRSNFWRFGYQSHRRHCV